MQNQWVPFGIGFVTGMRSMTASAALVWATALGRSRIAAIPASPTARLITTLAAFGEMAGDKMPFAPDRRIPASLLVRLAVGAAGGMALAGGDTPPIDAALSGIAGALVGTVLGRAARGRNTRTRADWRRALTEDIAAASLAALLVGSVRRRV